MRKCLTGEGFPVFLAPGDVLPPIDMNRFFIASLTLGLVFLSTVSSIATAKVQKLPTMKVIQTNPGISVILTESPGKEPDSHRDERDDDG